METLRWPLLVEGALLFVLVIFLIYRSTLSMHEDDQLFLTESESHMQKEQIEIMRKLQQVQ
jgi:Tfp pilus assembly protein PilN